MHKEETHLHFDDYYEDGALHGHFLEWWASGTVGLPFIFLRVTNTLLQILSKIWHQSCDIFPIPTHACFRFITKIFILVLFLKPICSCVILVLVASGWFVGTLMDYEIRKYLLGVDFFKIHSSTGKNKQSYCIVFSPIIKKFGETNQNSITT